MMIIRFTLLTCACGSICCLHFVGIFISFHPSTMKMSAVPRCENEGNEVQVEITISIATKMKKLKLI
jgi:hypothetical protein